MNKELFEDIQKTNKAEQDGVKAEPNAEHNNEVIPKSVDNLLSEHGKEFLNKILQDGEDE